MMAQIASLAIVLWTGALLVSTTASFASKPLLPGLHRHLNLPAFRENVVGRGLLSTANRQLHAPEQGVPRTHGAYPQPTADDLAAEGCHVASVVYVPSPLEAAQVQDCRLPFCSTQLRPGAAEEKQQLVNTLNKVNLGTSLLLEVVSGGPREATSGGNSMPHASLKATLSRHVTTYSCSGLGLPHHAGSTPPAGDATAQSGPAGSTPRQAGAPRPHGPSNFSVLSYMEPLYGLLRCAGLLRR